MDKRTPIQVSSDLSLIVEEGQYGKFVRLQRGKRWICLSAYAWDLFRSSKDKFTNVHFSLKLSDTKEVNVIDFKNKQYVSFHQRTKQGNKTYDSYINLSPDDWCKLVFSMPAVDNMMFPSFPAFDVPDTLLPERKPKLREPRNYCSECKDEMTAVILRNGRMKETNMTHDEYRNVKTSNKYALTKSCEYCGGSSFYQDVCHCHKFDCKECEPENFCKKCEGILFYSSEFSDIE